MFKTLLLVAVSLFFISCSTQPIPGHEKAFAEEDGFILLGLRSEQVKNHKSAAEIFKLLYDKSSKSEYLYRSIENLMADKQNADALKLADEILDDSYDDTILVRLKVVALFALEKYDESIALSIELAHLTKDPNDYLLVSDLYIKTKKYDLALKYLESAYVKEYDEKILDKMSIILYVNLNRKKEAIAQLETHSRMHGCSETICNRLVGFYSNDNNIDGLLATYNRIYENNKSEAIAKKIIQIYSYKQDSVSLMNFLENSKSDNETLLQLYIYSKNYEKAYLLSDELYKETLDIEYLGQSAIYEYENAVDKNSKKLLSNIIKKLEKVIQRDKKPLYLNYLGYILIDHEVDIKKGMTYIDKVLELQPNSSFYLDSKAWGYYKLGECKKAKSIMNKVVKLEGGDDPEVTAHVKKIDKCLKKKKVISKK